jgi:hypothetical protein
VLVTLTLWFTFSIEVDINFSVHDTKLLIIKVEKK